MMIVSSASTHLRYPLLSLSRLSNLSCRRRRWADETETDTICSLLRVNFNSSVSLCKYLLREEVWLSSTVTCMSIPQIHQRFVCSIQGVHILNILCNRSNGSNRFEQKSCDIKIKGEEIQIKETKKKRSKTNSLWSQSKRNNNYISYYEKLMFHLGLISHRAQSCLSAHSVLISEDSSGCCHRNAHKQPTMSSHTGNSNNSHRRRYSLTWKLKVMLSPPPHTHTFPIDNNCFGVLPIKRSRPHDGRNTSTRTHPALTLSQTLTFNDWFCGSNKQTV